MDDFSDYNTDDNLDEDPVSDLYPEPGDDEFVDEEVLDEFAGLDGGDDSDDF